MKKFVFTLDRLHNYKNQVLDREKNTLGQLRQRKAEIDRRLDNLHGELVRADLTMKEKQMKGITIAESRIYEFQIENMRFQISQTKLEQEEAARLVEQQLRVVVAASQEVAGLDKLMEKQFEEYRHEVAKADETVIAEFVSSKIAREQMAHSMHSS